MNRSKLSGVIFALFFMVGVAGAACWGPFCYDDRGAEINATVTNAAPFGLKSMTAAEAAAHTPTAAGQIIYCSNCLSVSDKVCVSTGTGRGAFVKISSGTTVCG